MHMTKKQIVGHFVFDDTTTTRSPGRRPQAFADRHGGDSAVTFAFFLAIAVATTALWYLGL